MVLENIASTIDSRPKLKFFLVGFLYLSIAMYIAIWKFSSHTGLAITFFTVLAAFPYFYSTIKKEEYIDFRSNEERKILKSHARILSYFLMFFIGIVVAVSFWSLILPNETVATTFDAQFDAIGVINPSLAGKATTDVGLVSQSKALIDIFSHNLEILILCIFFSFIYGAGALFVLTWNASIVGVAIASFVKLQSAGWMTSIGYGILRFSIHGIPEILAFITAGFAGGIISVAVIRHHIFTKKSHTIILDSSLLIAISLLLLFLAALLEVFVTPAFVSLF